MSENTTAKPARQWYQKKRWIFAIIIFLIIGFGAIGAGKSSTTSPESSKVVGSSNTSAQTDYKVGQVIENSGKQLTVTKVEAYNSGNQFIAPKAGKEFIKVAIELKNNSSDTLSFNPFDFKAQDSNGVQLTADASSYSLPDTLSSGNLAKGGKIAGAMVFEVPKGDKGVVLLYTASFWTNQEIKVKLF